MQRVHCRARPAGEEEPMKQRADVLLHRQGLADSREKARALIMAGRVYMDEVAGGKARAAAA
jgi:23S rRNA (cytidine1920-2'-O)/16S rRNA (cytidine1409-2'-O)-methyltransferase